MDHVSKPEGTVNPSLGVRFDRTGKFLPEAGNTVVSQVIPGSPTDEALIWLRRELQSLPFAHHFAFTDIASYHMTVFEGVIESRRQPHHWPASLPLDAEIPEMTLKMAAMLDGFASPPAFAIKPVAVTPFGLRLTAATDADEVNARAWRDALSDAFGFRTPGHDDYRFHTTLAYVHTWLPAAALPGYREAMERLTAAFVARVPAMDLAPVGFCTFADMNAFPQVRRL
jgi:hypothetical protein